jgi:hypothetical protein
MLNMHHQKIFEKTGNRPERGLEDKYDVLCHSRDYPVPKIHFPAVGQVTTDMLL